MEASGREVSAATTAEEEGDPRSVGKVLEKFRDWDRKSIDTLRFEACPTQYDTESLQLHWFWRNIEYNIDEPLLLRAHVLTSGEDKNVEQVLRPPEETKYINWLGEPYLEELNELEEEVERSVRIQESLDVELNTQDRKQRDWQRNQEELEAKRAKIQSRIEQESSGKSMSSQDQDEDSWKEVGPKGKSASPLLTEKKKQKKTEDVRELDATEKRNKQLELIETELTKIAKDMEQGNTNRTGILTRQSDRARTIREVRKDKERIVQEVKTEAKERRKLDLEAYKNYKLAVNALGNFISKLITELGSSNKIRYILEDSTKHSGINPLKNGKWALVLQNVKDKLFPDHVEHLFVNVKSLLTARPKSGEEFQQFYFQQKEIARELQGQGVKPLTLEELVAINSVTYGPQDYLRRYLESERTIRMTNRLNGHNLAKHRDEWLNRIDDFVKTQHESKVNIQQLTTGSSTAVPTGQQRGRATGKPKDGENSSAKASDTAATEPTGPTAAVPKDYNNENRPERVPRVCRDYRQGNCKYGEACKYLHINPSASNSQLSAIPKSNENLTAKRSEVKREGEVKGENQATSSPANRYGYDFYAHRAYTIKEKIPEIAWDSQASDHIMATAEGLNQIKLEEPIEISGFGGSEVIRYQANMDVKGIADPFLLTEQRNTPTIVSIGKYLNQSFKNGEPIVILTAHGGVRGIINDEECSLIGRIAKIMESRGDVLGKAHIRDNVFVETLNRQGFQQRQKLEQHPHKCFRLKMGSRKVFSSSTNDCIGLLQSCGLSTNLMKTIVSKGFIENLPQGINHKNIVRYEDHYGNDVESVEANIAIEPLTSEAKTPRSVVNGETIQLDICDPTFSRQPNVSQPSPSIGGFVRAVVMVDEASGWSDVWGVKSQDIRADILKRIIIYLRSIFINVKYIKADAEFGKDQCLAVFDEMRVKYVQAPPREHRHCIGLVEGTIRRLQDLAQGNMNRVQVHINNKVITPKQKAKLWYHAMLHAVFIARLQPAFNNPNESKYESVYGSKLDLRECVLLPFGTPLVTKDGTPGIYGRGVKVLYLLPSRSVKAGVVALNLATFHVQQSWTFIPVNFENSIVRKKLTNSIKEAYGRVVQGPAYRDQAKLSPNDGGERNKVKPDLVEESNQSDIEHVKYWNDEETIDGGVFEENTDDDEDIEGVSGDAIADFSNSTVLWLTANVCFSLRANPIESTSCDSQEEEEELSFDPILSSVSDCQSTTAYNQSCDFELPKSNVKVSVVQEITTSDSEKPTRCDDMRMKSTSDREMSAVYDSVAKSTGVNQKEFTTKCDSTISNSVNVDNNVGSNGNNRDRPLRPPLPHPKLIPQLPAWRNAIVREVTKLLAAGTFAEVSHLPDDANCVMRLFPIFEWKWKMDPAIGIERWYECCRIVCDGSEVKETEEHYYAETPEALATLIQIALDIIKRAITRSSDANRAYLQSRPVNPNQFVITPKLLKMFGLPGYALLLKALYGSPSSALSWEHFSETALFKCGFEKLSCLRSTYAKQLMNGIIRVVRHSDDFSFGGITEENLQEAEEVFDQLCSLIDMPRPKPMKRILGWEFKRYDKNGNPCESGEIVLITMKEKIMKLINETKSTCEMFNKTNKRRLTPAPVDVVRWREVDKVVPYDKLLDEKDHSYYRSILGQLLYIAINARHDIRYAVFILSLRSTKPRVWDLRVATWVIDYLKETVELPLVLNGSNLKPEIYCDASYQSVYEGRSIRANIMRLSANSGVIYASVHCIHAAVKSVFHAELYACSDAVDTGVFIRNVLMELKEVNEDYRITVQSDSKSVVDWSKGINATLRSRGIESMLFNVRHVVNDGIIDVVHVSGSENPCDLFTKILPYEIHWKHVMNVMGLNGVMHMRLPGIKNYAEIIRTSVSDV